MGVLEKVDKTSFVITPTPTREKRAASYGVGLTI
ncbi:hypothetical protein PR003_g19602 [Phytophthora rubi]|uniref:Uncharacterized protein n=1 Tax=Phytophthora rubi TaxID=129364 RepID=A0A6A3K4L7_9STRA|nr:hypothetical protein PR001_g18347 [Phytophthora rubi]KAE9313053.1 hypothetical protein PR003_g19602 [Phytophthora rubi]